VRREDSDDAVRRMMRDIYDQAVISLLHVASGAAAGAVMRSRTLALVVGPALHLAGDRVPHQDIESRNFELASGLGGAALLALRYGPAHPVTLGALSAAAPDVEHLFPFLRPAGVKLFHGRRGWHRSGWLPSGLQLSVAAVVIGLLAIHRPGLR
jgi:hypothetical protein